MKLTDRDKRTIPVVIIAALVISLFFFYPWAHQTDLEQPPPETRGLRHFSQSTGDLNWTQSKTENQCTIIR
jgi:hypothetical protein